MVVEEFLPSSSSSSSYLQTGGLAFWLTTTKLSSLLLACARAFSTFMTWCSPSSDTTRTSFAPSESISSSTRCSFSGSTFCVLRFRGLKLKLRAETAQLEERVRGRERKKEDFLLAKGEKFKCSENALPAFCGVDGDGLFVMCWRARALETSREEKEDDATASSWFTAERHS